MINKDFEDTVNDLYSYGNMEDNEWGDTATQLCQLWYSRSTLSDEFIQSLANEIQEFLTYVQENATIKSETKTYTRTEEYLEWNDG